MNNREVKGCMPFYWHRDSGGEDYNFFIPSKKSALTDSEYSDLVERTISFHKDYITISRKYKLCELYTDEFMDFRGENLIEQYLIKLEDYFVNTGISFFPYINEGLMFASFVSYVDVENDLNSIYIYGFDDKNMQFVYDKERIFAEKGFPLDNIISFYLEECYHLGDLFYSVSFNLGFFSNLFYPYVFTAGLHNFLLNNYSIDNRFVSYLNAPRFNSFLRDLKDIWVNKYQWKFEFGHEIEPVEFSAFDKEKYLTSSGILLDGKIIYQEDIDEGRVKLPDISEFGLKHPI